MRSKAKLVALVGPTAVGKTAVSLALGERLQAEIVSADSRLFYRGMDIGTDKPGPEERSRVPHHLIDILDPDESFSMAKYLELAYQAIDQVHERNHPALLVGGSGQYVRAVTEGWLPPSHRPRSGIRKILERWGNEIGRQGLHDRLAALDPEAARRIDYRNTRRTIRALEVILTSGEKFSNTSRQARPRYEVLQIGLDRPRQALYERIDRRIDSMFESGLVEETRTLLNRGNSRSLPAMSAIGYAQVSAYLCQEISLEEARVLIRRKTREFVRRQANWFRKSDPHIHWFSADEDPVDQIESLIRGFYKM